jgi:hypothetical protein
VVHRRVNFNTVMMGESPVHKCVIHPDTEIHVLPRLNASRCSGEEKVFVASDPCSKLGNELWTYHSTLNKHINTRY